VVLYNALVEQPGLVEVAVAFAPVSAPSTVATCTGLPFEGGVVTPRPVNGARVAP